MEAEESKISVWVCREEKLVSGLTKHTTCADVIRVLLEEQNGVELSLSGSPRSYCVVEKWRGFERSLPNKTKILRLWSAWGEEQENVRFVLVKNEASLASSGPRSAEARVVLSKESQCAYRGTARVTMALSQEKQRRMVRKAFRKLEKINKKKAQSLSKDASSMEKMETMVHLVVSQDHTIRQQVQRIQELDREIDRYEAKVHFDRMKMHGINYVQDTYLVDTNPEENLLGEGGTVGSSEALARFEEFAERCEKVIQLQERLAEQEALMETITADIQEELNQRWMRRRQEELSHKEPEGISTETREESDASSENELALEEERIRTQLDTSLYIGLRLNTDLEAIKNDLDLTEEIWNVKEKELMDLLKKGDCGDFEEDIELEETVESEEVTPLKGDSVWVEQARGLAKTCDMNDDDSDTGLSSMHSQDSDITAIFESLV